MPGAVARGRPALLMDATKTHHSLPIASAAGRRRSLGLIAAFPCNRFFMELPVGFGTYRCIHRKCLQGGAISADVEPSTYKNRQEWARERQ